MTVWPLDFPSLATKGHQKCYREKCLFSLNFVLLHFAVDAFHTFSHSNSLPPLTKFLSHPFPLFLSQFLTISLTPPHILSLSSLQFLLNILYTLLCSFFISNLLTLSHFLSLSLQFEFLSLSHAHSSSLSLSHHSSSQVLIEQTWST